MDRKIRRNKKEEEKKTFKELIKMHFTIHTTWAGTTHKSFHEKLCTQKSLIFLIDKLGTHFLDNDNFNLSLPNKKFCY